MVTLVAEIFSRLAFRIDSQKKGKFTIYKTEQGRPRTTRSACALQANAAIMIKLLYQIIICVIIYAEISRYCHRFVLLFAY